MNHADQTIVRITNISLKHFKNVNRGTVTLGRESNVEEGFSDIFGIYGQNGSGKTSIINAIALIQNILRGNPLTSDTKDFINIDSNDMSIKMEFYITSNNLKYLASYDVTIKSLNHETVISKESLSFKKYDVDTDKWSEDETLLTINNELETIEPKASYNEIIKYYNNESDLIVNRKISYKQKSSFLFSEDFLSLIKNIENDFILLDILNKYAHYNLFVIDNTLASLSSSNIILPINFRNYHFKGHDTGGVLPIELSHPTKFKESILKEIEYTLLASNIVLSQLIPNFSVEIKRLGTEIDNEGEEVISFELLSVRENRSIPIRYESDGIKKIIAIVHLLIAMYNNPTISVVIDELDAGIFEYLLGEILQIIEERAEGQLIFTSHNLRPLEVLNKKNLIFSTTNPNNRFITLKHDQSYTNLRDFYYRDIILNGQEEKLYDYTNTSQIAFAFRMAGEKNQ